MTDQDTIMTDAPSSSDARAQHVDALLAQLPPSPWTTASTVRALMLKCPPQTTSATVARTPLWASVYKKLAGADEFARNIGFDRALPYPRPLPSYDELEALLVLGRNARTGEKGLTRSMEGVMTDAKLLWLLDDPREREDVHEYWVQRAQEYQYPAPPPPASAPKTPPTDAESGDTAVQEQAELQSQISHSPHTEPTDTEMVNDKDTKDAADRMDTTDSKETSDSKDTTDSKESKGTTTTESSKGTTANKDTTKDTTTKDTTTKATTPKNTTPEATTPQDTSPSDSTIARTLESLLADPTSATSTTLRALLDGLVAQSHIDGAARYHVMATVVDELSAFVRQDVFRQAVQDAVVDAKEDIFFASGMYQALIRRRAEPAKLTTTGRPDLENGPAAAPGLAVEDSQGKGEHDVELDRLQAHLDRVQGKVDQFQTEIDQLRQAVSDKEPGI